jgi:dihydropteroate synthase/2-amino-4-hydroxy-6-hydroxymethyldihydropteridine diphosphokinase
MILIALGANLPSAEGAPRETLRRALASLAARGLPIVARSRLFLTEPVPRSSQPWYVNQVVAVRTDRAPEEILGTLLAVERQFGRERGERNAARALDLDLIAYRDLRLDTPELVLPHPRMQERAFVLAPLADIAPEWRHPVLGETAAALLARTDRTGVRALKDTPLLMGVVNVTPDSFSDGGRFETTEAAIAQAVSLMEAGADILDIGGESTRPGADPVPESEELDRVIPVIEGIRAENADVRISIDTSKAGVAEAALDAGADYVNDVTALRGDPDMAALVAEREAGVCLMHMLGTPRTTQAQADYDDVVADVKAFLAARIEAATAAGIALARIEVDPGIGFAKTVDHNLELLHRLGELTDLGRPIVLGTSRKSFLGKITGRETAERMPATLATVVMGYERGAEVFRVHDVAPARDALAVAAATLARGWPTTPRTTTTTT